MHQNFCKGLRHFIGSIIVAPIQGKTHTNDPVPRALPWAGMLSPGGATVSLKGCNNIAPNDCALRSSCSKLPGVHGATAGSAAGTAAGAAGTATATGAACESSQNASQPPARPR